MQARLSLADQRAGNTFAAQSEVGNLLNVAAHVRSSGRKTSP
jgi:hypothetical protein